MEVTGTLVKQQSDSMLEIAGNKYYKTVYIEEKVERKNIYAFSAKLAFFMFVFFTLFGTSLPFRERVLDIAEVGTSNSTNHIVFISMFFLSLIAAVPKLNQLGRFILHEKFLYIFMAWCAISILWSDYPFVAFKRYFQLFTVVMTITVALTYMRTDKEFLKFLKPITAIYIIASFISVFTIPAALDEHGVWRGLATGKNHLGQAALVCVLVWIFAFKNSTLLEKIFISMVLGMSTILLFGSESSTSIFAFLIMVLVGSFFVIDNQFKKIKVGRFFSALLILSALTFVVYAFAATPDLVNSFLGNFGEDITFTGRTWLWEDIMREAKTHLWLGTGFQSYWVITNNDLLKLYEIYIWLPKQSHNGYLDILNEVGVIGAAFFLLMVISFFIAVTNLRQPKFWVWFFVTVLIINLQESNLFQGSVLLGNIFLLSYLVVKMRIYDQRTIVEDYYENEESETGEAETS